MNHSTWLGLPSSRANRLGTQMCRAATDKNPTCFDTQSWQVTRIPPALIHSPGRSLGPFLWPLLSGALGGEDKEDACNFKSNICEQGQQYCGSSLIEAIGWIYWEYLFGNLRLLLLPQSFTISLSGSGCKPWKVFSGIVVFVFLKWQTFFIVLLQYYV